MSESTNYKKHTSKRFTQRFLVSNFYKSLNNLIKPLKPKKILDAGCGEGFTIKNLSNNGIGEVLIGVEQSPEVIAMAKKINPGIKIKKGSVYSLPFKARSFDLVICTEVLEHLEQPEKALRELLRVSKRNVVVSVPNEPWFMLSNFFRGRYFSSLGNVPGHIKHWSRSGFLAFLKKEGYKIQSVRTPFPWILVQIRVRQNKLDKSK